jgi:ankyrin repeat protein
LEYILNATGKSENDLINSVDNTKHTPLLMGFITGNKTVLEKYLMNEKININAVNNQKQNIFHLSSIHNTGECLILNSYNDEILKSKHLNDLDSFEKAPIHYCAEKNHLKTLKVLHRYQCNLNKKDMNGNTALHLSLITESDDVKDYLVSINVRQDLKNNYNVSATMLINELMIRKEKEDNNVEDNKSNLDKIKMKKFGSIESLKETKNKKKSRISLLMNFGKKKDKKDELIQKPLKKKEYSNEF